jgi:hypothetical protein
MINCEMLLLVFETSVKFLMELDFFLCLCYHNFLMSEGQLLIRKKER